MQCGLTYFTWLADLSKDSVEKVFLGRLAKYAWFAWYRPKWELRRDGRVTRWFRRRIPYGVESTGAKTRHAFWCKDVPAAVHDLVSALRAQGRATSETVEIILADIEPAFRKLDPLQPGFDNNAYLAFSADWSAEALAAVKKAECPPVKAETQDAIPESPGKMPRKRRQWLNGDFAVAKGFENRTKDKRSNWIKNGRIDGRIAGGWTPVYNEFLEFCKEVSTRNKDKRFSSVLERVTTPEDLQALFREAHRRPIKV